jgi:flagellar basal-body rod protein FlgB
MADLLSGANNEKIVNTLSKALDGAAKRHQILTNNIANIDTPNFKRSDISFEQTLKRAVENASSGSLPLATTNPGHIAFVDNDPTDYPIVQENNFTFRNDGNNVDIEKEVAEATKNNLLYNSYTQMLVSKLGLMKSAIQEQGR